MVDFLGSNEVVHRLILFAFEVGALSVEKQFLNMLRDRA